MALGDGLLPNRANGGGSRWLWPGNPAVQGAPQESAGGGSSSARFLAPVRVGRDDESCRIPFYDSLKLKTAGKAAGKSRLVGPSAYPRVFEFYCTARIGTTFPPAPGAQ